MPTTFISVGSDEEPVVEVSRDANVVYLHFGPNTSVSMTREQWAVLRVQGGESS